MDYPEIDLAFGHWLAGFIDGEGCFTAHKRGPTHKSGGYLVAFKIQLRADDLCILEEIQARTGLGRIHSYPNTGSRSLPVAILSIGSKSDLARLVELLDAFPLRAKKARDYAIWREAVLDYTLIPTQHRTKRDWGRIPALADELRQVRSYA